jgi:hypothetical protein
MSDEIRKAMERAFRLGQTYWQQADSEYTSHHRKADTTWQTFNDLRDNTCAQYDAALAARDERVRELEAELTLQTTAHASALRSLQKQAPCFADTERLDAVEKGRWGVGSYHSGNCYVHIGPINGKQSEVLGSTVRAAIDAARALLAPPAKPCGECHLQAGETCDICGATKEPT